MFIFQMNKFDDLRQECKTKIEQEDYKFHLFSKQLQGKITMYDWLKLRGKGKAIKRKMKEKVVTILSTVTKKINCLKESE